MKRVRPLLLTLFAIGCVSSVRGGELLPGVDVKGPDGIVYPDWTSAGVPGGIPQVPVRAKLEDFGARPDDGLDDGKALEEAAREIGRKGGGAILLDDGVYHLDRPVVIVHDGVVVRGRGPDRTRLVNRYGAPDGGVGFFRPRPGETVGPGTWVEVHCDPQGLRAVRILADGKPVAARERGQHWGGTFNLYTTGRSILRAVGPGAHRLGARAEYAGREPAEATMEIRLDPEREDPPRIPRYLGAITFVGRAEHGGSFPLSRDGKRGDTRLELRSTAGLKAGMCVAITAPATERWNKLVMNRCRWGSYRMNQYRILAVEGNTVEINQPLRIDFPAVDGSFIQRIEPIRRCGVEDLSLNQVKSLWTSGVIFSHAWECWARNVHVTKAGRWPVYTSPAKWCEIRDGRFDDAWYHGGGGTAYVGFERAFDCLMENVRTSKMRHAPCFQWAASGNVIRKSTFVQSDGQWHAGWTNENLIEQCTIDASQGTGSYGHGFWASPPEDEAHGPNGPRNVVYNCDVTAPRAGLWMGGMNHGWLILHNRIVCRAGPAVYMKTNSDGHLIQGNRFVVTGGKATGLTIATDDCDGVRFLDNEVYGVPRLAGGKGRPASVEGSRMLPVPEGGLPDRPRPAIPSIFEWQRRGGRSRSRVKDKRRRPTVSRACGPSRREAAPAGARRPTSAACGEGEGPAGFPDNPGR